MKAPLDVRQLRAFLTVAELGNVTRAAEALHLVQPAVSRQLRLLEEDLGCRLFERERHGMDLTNEGRALIGYARRALLELERARAELTAASTEVGGLVTIGLLPSTCDLLASAIVERVSTLHPGIQLRLAMGYAGTLRTWLESGEVDAALLFGVDRSTDLLRQPLIEEALWVVAPHQAKLRSNRPIPFKDLANQGMILPSASHGIRALVDHAAAICGIELQVRVETNSMNIQRSLVLGGHGWTILPPIAVADDLAQRRLCAAPIAEPAIKRTIVLGYAANRSPTAAARLTVDIVRQCARDAIASGAWREAKWLAD